MTRLGLAHGDPGQTPGLDAVATKLSFWSFSRPRSRLKQGGELLESHSVSAGDCPMPCDHSQCEPI